MAKSTRQYIFEGMEKLPESLIPFVEKRLEIGLHGYWQAQVAETIKGIKSGPDGNIAWDQASLFSAMDRFWGDAFRMALGKFERSIVNELSAVRNKLAHNETFTYDDAERALDSMRRLLEAIGAGTPAEQIGTMRDAILRTKFRELQRNEARRQTQQAFEGFQAGAAKGLLPWREIVEPHQNVATGEFLQSEFAADLGKVRAGSATPEYGDPREFFSRTYLTDGLSSLLVGAAKRLSGAGGDPVVEMQTNFGGGKTHSMLALYHMAGNIPIEELPGLDQLFSKNNLPPKSKINRAVVVGTWRGPTDVLKKGNLEIRTTWGEIAWQLGGPEAYEMVADNDARGIAPGSDLLEALFTRHSPCLILIDEWVAYLRQIYRVADLPSGSFDANLTFVQSLTEAVKTSPRTLLVATLPASQIEVGGEGGQEALTRLKQTFARVESSWRSASQEESYEIVRRKLFKEIPGDKYHHRDNTIKQFAELYREHSGKFPQNATESDYSRKLEKSYPIHPELFDQLYSCWGSLERFQRTRGVLRLMAQAIYELWMKNDPSVMIMSGSLTIGSDRVQPELLHYLDISWQSIIAGDIDGADSIPYEIDRSTPNLNKFAAARRVARTIFLGTAPTHQQENRGIDGKRINLGVVQPGENPVVFGDALRRLANQARFLHTDLGRYWYSMAPSLNRIAAERAEQIEDALVSIEIDKQLAAYIGTLGDRGHFDSVQIAPKSSDDIPDQLGGIRAVVLGVSHPHNGGQNSEASRVANEFLSHRGSVPRVYRNVLIFLAAEARQLENVKDSIRMKFAWESIVADTERLNLTHSDSANAMAKSKEALAAVESRIREAWCYLLYPRQEEPGTDVAWISGKVAASDGLLKRASLKLANEEGVLPELGPERLQRELLKYFWKDNNHLSLKYVIDCFDRFIYLPRLKNSSVLAQSVRSSIGQLIPGPFAYAESRDEHNDEYRGLLVCNALAANVVIDNESLLVGKEAAEAHSLSKPAAPVDPGSLDPEQPPVESPPPLEENLPTHVSGSVPVSSERPARDIQIIVESVIQQLTPLPDSDVSITLEISAHIPKGLDRSKVRTLAENMTTLGFTEKSIK